MHNHDHHLRPIIGIVSPGEMGTCLGKLLVEGGFPVVTTLDGRSSRTSQLCSRAGLRPLPTFEDVVVASEIFVSLVPPGAAISLAETYCNIASTKEGAPIYIDANSISPATAAAIEALMQRRGIAMVDASIHGLASRLSEQGTMFLSGPASRRVASLMAGVVRVEVLGDRCGTASMFKMLLGGVSKGIVGLFVEMGLAAAEVQMLEPFLRMCRAYYPGMMEAIDRLLPTLPRHARRRAAEMEELESTLHSLGLSLGIAAEIKRLYRLLGESPLRAYADQFDAEMMTPSELLELFRSVVPLRFDVAESESAVASHH